MKLRRKETRKKLKQERDELIRFIAENMQEEINWNALHSVIPPQEISRTIDPRPRRMVRGIMYPIDKDGNIIIEEERCPTD